MMLRWNSTMARSTAIRWHRSHVSGRQIETDVRFAQSIKPVKLDRFGCPKGTKTSQRGKSPVLLAAPRPARRAGTVSMRGRTGSPIK
jgi:hypothetical protein